MMGSDAIEAVRADRDALLQISAALTAADWQAGSGCPGWSVQDVVAHLGLLFWNVVDASRLPDISGLPTERAQEVCVASRRDWDAAAVLADYEEVSDTALDQLKGLAALDMEVPLGDLGTYQASALPSAFAFDHYTHIRADLFEPRGPLAGPPPPSDELRARSALDWIEAALPQQNPAAEQAGTFELRIHGTGGRTIRFGSGPARAVISSDVPAFVRWVTQRGSWAELGVQADGDVAALAAAGGLKVF
jgi:uncharacterized protein (TIGR03083 family)